MLAKELIESGRRAIVEEGDRLDAEGREREEAAELLSFVAGTQPHPDDPVPAATRRRYDRLLARRLTGEPLAYIVGTTEFNGMRLYCGPGAFVPRESSAFLAAQAIRRLRPKRTPVHVDVATGIGPVALAVAQAVPHADVHGADLSARAIALARRNARALGLSNVTFHRGDLFAALPRTLRSRTDVVTSHPPYVPRAEIRDLPSEIRDFEPVSTLTDGSRDGLALVHRIADEAAGWLRPGGWLLIEVMPSLARTVRAILARSGYRDVRGTRGGNRYTRVVVGRSSSAQ